MGGSMRRIIQSASEISRRGRTVSARALSRRARQALMERIAPAWTGTRESLRGAIRRFLRPYRRSLSFLFRISREARFAALVAAALLSGGAGAVSASLAINLSSITSGTGGFAINGESLGDLAGISISSAGDVNGDGLADVIVGAEGADRSYVVFGKTGTTSVELSDIAAGNGGFVINGEVAADDFGTSVSSAGDVNGDGLADLIVGARRADPNGSNSGRSYVIFGKSTTTAVELSAIRAGIGGFVINGEATDNESGASVSTAGDVNDDGLADLIVGAPQAYPFGSAPGRGYVVFGKATTTPIELSDLAAGTGGFVINGEAAADRAGFSVSEAGDVNGDGLGDLIVGAFYADPHGSDSGRSYVIFGKTTTTPVDLSEVAAGTGGFVISGEAAGDGSGGSVSSAGDVNGDGLADLIIGAASADPHGLSYAGRSYVVFGKADTTPVELSAISIGTGGFVINGGHSYDYAGKSVSYAGDVNGDGFADVIIGAFKFFHGGSYVGRSYVVFGKSDTTTVELSDVAAGSGGFAMTGESPGDYSGLSVSSAGDVNGDGLPDLLVGAPFAAAHGVSSGRSYVIFSSETPPASATYVARTGVGDGPGGNPVASTLFSNARITIDFSDDDTADNGSGGASTETIALTHSNSGITGLSPLSDVANVVWHVTTDRSGFNSANVTLHYTDAEIAGISGGEGGLRIYKAPTLSGPWTQLSTTIDTARNEAKATVTGFSFFTLAAPGVPVELSEFKIE